MYVPCFNLYGFQEFGLNEEQCKLVEGETSDIYGEYQSMNKSLTAKTTQVLKLEEKVKQLQKQNELLELSLK